MESPPAKIVIVEDDPLLMRAYHEAIAAKGFTIEMFFNADDAYRATRSPATQRPPLAQAMPASYNFLRARV